MKLNRRTLAENISKRIETLELSFKSRGADFIISTSEYVGMENFAVSFRVGPISISISAEEARALGAAMIECADHYDKIRE